METDSVGIAQWAGTALGTALLLSVAWVWMRKQIFGLNGVGVSAFGVVLVGLTLWQSVQISYSAEGVELQLTRLEKQVEETQEKLEATTDELGRVRATNAVMSASLLQLTEANEFQDIRYQRLAESLQSSGTVVSPAIPERRFEFDTDRLRDIAQGQINQ